MFTMRIVVGTIYVSLIISGVWQLLLVTSQGAVTRSSRNEG
jgi:hypothetical protein